MYFIILNTNDEQFTLTTKKTLHLIFKPYTTNQPFQVATARVCSALPVSTRIAESYIAFRQQIKTLHLSVMTECDWYNHMIAPVVTVAVTADM